MNPAIASAGLMWPAVPPPASNTFIFAPLKARLPAAFCAKSDAEGGVFNVDYVLSMFAVREIESTMPICASSIISELPP